LPSALSQIPQGFNYQAVLRDNPSNNPIVSQGVQIRFTIQTAGSVVVYQETHSTTTDDFGTISLVVGGGTPVGAYEFSEINWSVPLSLKTEFEYPVSGTPDYDKLMGTTPLKSVPYALVAKDVEGPVEKLDVIGTTENDEEALFEVRNKDGQVVFAVYNEGIRAYVNEIDEKGAKGGFAIGGFGTTKEDEEPQNFLFVSGDSVRVYIDNADIDPVKGPKGGFAIGGFGMAKAGPQQFLTVSNDSVRIYIDNNTTDKGVKGGFAIGGYGVSKGKPQKLLTVSDDSVRIYLNDSSKGVKGGFAIGGFDKAKGDGANTSFFNVSTEASEKIKPSEPRILWYPLKNAFLAGQVLIEHPDSVGTNSFAAGYEAKPKGDFSQALGYKARTEGISSTAIGNYSFAKGSNSFSLGDSAYVSSADGYAIGAGARATGLGSFAIGSKNRAFGENYELSTSATGAYSLAIGLDADAEGGESFAAGISVKAQGEYSVALGRSATASGNFSMALQGIASGMGSVSIGGGSAEAYNSIVIGNGTSSAWQSIVIGDGVANNDYAVAIGENASATGDYAIAAGLETTAQAYGSFVIGYFNKISGTKESIVSTDPVFVIGNGTSITPSNAFTVLKNGYTAVGHDNPGQMLDINGQIKIRGGSPAAGRILTSDADGDATWEALPSHSHSTADLTSGSLTVARGGTGNSTITLNKVLVGNGTSAVLSPANLHWDNTNSRLGIVNTSPQYNIDVTGTLRTTSTTNLATAGANVGIGTITPTNKLHIENGTGAAKIYVNGTTGNASLEYRVSGTYVGAFGANLDDSYIFMYSGGNLSLKDGKVGIGNTAPGQKLDITGGYGRVESGYSWLTNSDARYKKNITELQESLGKIMEIRGVRFDLAADEDVIDGQGRHIGFVAQELERVFPEMVLTGDDGYKAVAYDKIGPVLVEAIKEQQEQIEQLKAIVAGMKEEIASLRSQ